MVRGLHLNTLVSSLTYKDDYHVIDCVNIQFCHVEIITRDEVIGMAVGNAIVLGLICGGDTGRQKGRKMGGC